MFKLLWTKIYKTAVYDSDTCLTLKQDQGHQTWYKIVDPKLGDNKAKFEKSRLNGVCEKANNKVLVKSANMPVISLEYAQKKRKKKKEVVYL